MSTTASTTEDFRQPNQPRMVEVRSKHGRGGSYRRDMFRNYLDGRIERTTS
jgi:hypothetical protein